MHRGSFLRVGGRHARVPCVCACARPSLPGRAGRRPGRVLVRLTFSFGRFVFLLCSAPCGLGLPLSYSFVCLFCLLRCSLCAPRWSLAFSGFRPRVPRAFVLCFSLHPPPPSPFFFLFSSVLRPRCFWLSLVSGPGCPGPLRCVWFDLLIRRLSAPRALSLLLCFLPGRSLLPGGCCPPAPPPSPFVSRGFCRCRWLPFLFFVCFFLPALLLPAGSALVGGSHRLSAPPLLLFVLLVSSCSGLRVLWLLLCFPPGRWLPSGRCCPPPPPPPFCVSRFLSLPRSAPFFFFFLFFSFAALPLPACSALVGGSHRLLPPPPPAVCFVGLPLLCSPCALAAFVFPAWSLADPWWLLPPPPPPPFCVSGFSSLPLGAPFFFPSSAALLPPAFLALVGGSRRLLPPPPYPGACVVPCAVRGCFAALPFRGVFCGSMLPCSACSRCGLLSAFGLRCRVLCCTVCPCLRCFAALLRVVPPVVLLLCALLFCFARGVPLLVVPCPLALPIALGPCSLRHCILRCSPALCALCCVCLVVACWCVLLFAAVLCAVCALGCHAVRSLSSPLCAVLCFAVLVRLRCAVLVMRTVAGAWCCGALLCVVLFPLVFCGAVLGLVARGCLLVACFGVGVPVGPRGLLPCGWCGLLWCPASLCRVLWCCAVAWCCAVVLCCRFAVLFVFALPSCGLSCGALLCCVVLLVVCGAFCPVVASVCCAALSLPAVAWFALQPVFSPTLNTTANFGKIIFLAFENKIKLYTTQHARRQAARPRVPHCLTCYPAVVAVSWMISSLRSSLWLWSGRRAISACSKKEAEVLRGEHEREGEVHGEWKRA